LLLPKTLTFSTEDKNIFPVPFKVTLLAVSLNVLTAVESPLIL
jgi:hypothetical protein